MDGISHQIEIFLTLLGLTLVTFLVVIFFVIQRLKSEDKKWSKPAYISLVFLLLFSGRIAFLQIESQDPYLFISMSALSFFSIFLMVIIYMKDRGS